MTYEDDTWNILFLLKTYICAWIHLYFDMRPRPFLWVWACWLDSILFFLHSTNQQVVINKESTISRVSLFKLEQEFQSDCEVS